MWEYVESISENKTPITKARSFTDHFLLGRQMANNEEWFDYSLELEKILRTSGWNGE